MVVVVFVAQQLLKVTDSRCGLRSAIGFGRVLILIHNLQPSAPFVCGRPERRREGRSKGEAVDEVSFQEREVGLAGPVKSAGGGLTSLQHEVSSRTKVSQEADSKMELLQ
jgi:hypothetical protein